MGDISEGRSLILAVLLMAGEVCVGFIKGFAPVGAIILAIAGLSAVTGALVSDGAPTGLHPTGFDPAIARGLQ